MFDVDTDAYEWEKDFKPGDWVIGVEDVHVGAYAQVASVEGSVVWSRWFTTSGALVPGSWSNTHSTLRPKLVKLPPALAAEPAAIATWVRLHRAARTES